MRIRDILMIISIGNCDKKPCFLNLNILELTIDNNTDARMVIIKGTKSLKICKTIILLLAIVCGGET